MSNEIGIGHFVVAEAAGIGTDVDGFVLNVFTRSEPMDRFVLTRPYVEMGQGTRRFGC
jgi:hypothetical protein